MDSQLRNIILLAVVGVALYYLLPRETSQMEFNADVPELEETENVNVEEQPVEEQPVEEQLVEEQLELNELSSLNEDVGASLDNAFEGAVPPNTNVDEVDFNRNNVEEYDASNFLPQETNDEWFDTDFTKAKYNLNNDKMINTNRYMIGVNTVGQSLKNPAYDIRGTIANPKYTVSPWNNSTYEPDTNIKSLY